MTHTTSDAAIHPHLAKLIDIVLARAWKWGHGCGIDDISEMTTIGDSYNEGKRAETGIARADLERAYAAHTAPGLRRALEIIQHCTNRALREYGKGFGSAAAAVMEEAMGAIRAELDQPAPAKPTTLDDMIAEMHPEDQARVADRALELIDEEANRSSIFPKFDVNVPMPAGCATPPATPDRAAAMRKVCEALGFEPDNHHNALKCPYCNPNGLELATTSCSHPVGVDVRDAISNFRLPLTARGFRILDDTSELMATALTFARAKAIADLVNIASRPAPSVVSVTEAEERIKALETALRLAEAALADIGDADRDEGDDLAWCEARAAKPLPAIRAALGHTAADGEKK